jgi:hypothetical protein
MSNDEIKEIRSLPSTCGPPKRLVGRRIASTHKKETDRVKKDKERSVLHMQDIISQRLQNLGPAKLGQVGWADHD